MRRTMLPVRRTGLGVCVCVFSRCLYQLQQLRQWRPQCVAVVTDCPASLNHLKEQQPAEHSWPPPTRRNDASFNNNLCYYYMPTSASAASRVPRPPRAPPVAGIPVALGSRRAYFPTVRWWRMFWSTWASARRAKHVKVREFTCRTWTNDDNDD